MARSDLGLCNIHILDRTFFWGVICSNRVEPEFDLP